MGQSSSKLRKKHSNSSTRSQELNVEAEEFVNRSKVEKELTRSLCDYNRALMVQSSVVKSIEETGKSITQKL